VSRSQATAADWLLRLLTVVVMVLTVVLRPSVAIVVVPALLLGLILSLVNPTPRWRTAGIFVLVLGVVALGSELA
jgi:hypothetical protein